MRKIIITSIGLLLLTTNTFALDLFGPPVTTSNKDQFIAGLEYLYSEMDLHTDSLTVATPLGTLQFPSAEIKSIEMNKFNVNILSLLGRNNYDFFLRLGITDASSDKGKNRENLGGSIGDGDYTPNIGGGFRTTLYQSNDGKTKWGLLAQLSYVSLDFDKKIYSVNGSDISLSATIDMLEIQIAAGPIYQVTDKISIYGGPFLHFVKGDVELRGNVGKIPIQGSSDLEQCSELGGFFGLSTDLAKNTKFNIEFQLTDDAQALGFRFFHRF